jgi:type I restriction enzyme S subunit
MSGLPISWLNTHLEDLITLEMGQAPAGSKCNKTGNGTPFVKAGEFGSTHPVIREWTTNPLRYGKQGDVFLCVVGATSGKINYGIECAIGRSVAALRPYLGLETHFLYHFLSTRIMHLRSGTAGSAQGVISKSDINFISIPLPPLAEQRRIVAKIEELFSELDAGEESLRRAQRQLGVYRQSLLKQAFEGKLTKCLKVEKYPLRSLITNLGQGWSPKCELNRPAKPDEWAVIKTTAIQHCRYDDSEAKPLPPPFEPRPSIEIQDGDFLMTRKGPRTRAGVSCYVRNTRKRLMICDTVYRFRCVEEKVYPLYLELALNSPDVLRAIDRLKAGISESGLSLTHTKVGTVEIPLCSLPEQREIVRLLDEQFTVIEQNEREIDAALKRSAALRQSILKKAFTGQLVPQDSTEEPASALLERIREERQLADHISKRKTARKKAKAI